LTDPHICLFFRPEGEHFRCTYAAVYTKFSYLAASSRQMIILMLVNYATFSSRGIKIAQITEVKYGTAEQTNSIISWQIS